MSTVKTYTGVGIKAAERGENQEGKITALVSIFGNIDKMGDRVVRGSFKESLAVWVASGDPIPMIFSHDWGSIDAHIGGWTSGRETERGLELTGTVDLTDPASAKVFKLLERRTLREFSFAYDVLDERRASDGANELLRLHILEAGPTLRGANTETELLSIKSSLAARPPGSSSPTSRRAASTSSLDFEEELRAKGYDHVLVARLFGNDPASKAALVRAREREAALGKFRAVNDELALGGTIPGVAADRARAADQLDRDRADDAVREAEREADREAHEQAAARAHEQILDEMPAAFGGRQGRQ